MFVLVPSMDLVRIILSYQSTIIVPTHYNMFHLALSPSAYILLDLFLLQAYLQQIQTPVQCTLTAQISIMKKIPQISVDKDFFGQYIQRLRFNDETITASHPKNLRCRRLRRRDEISWDRENSVSLSNSGIEIERHF